MHHHLTTRQRTVIATCVRAAHTENSRFPLTADACRDLVNSVSDGTATDAEYEAAAVIAAYAPHAQPETSSRDWRVLRRALEHFDGDIHEAHPYWRDLVRHHLAIGAYSS